MKFDKRLRLIARLAMKLGVRAFVVGGVVRDGLLKKKNLDLDIVVEKKPRPLVKQLARRFGARVKTYPDFGTFILTLPDGTHIDVATARKEAYVKPGALPTVRFGSLREDLFRRDFTVNAMAVPLTSAAGTPIIDYYGGVADLKRKVLRVLHERSFIDDPTRILRLARFAGRGFKVERKTLRFSLDARRYLAEVSIERIREEILALLQEKNPYPALKLLSQWDLWGVLFPGVPFTPQLQRLARVRGLAKRMHILLSGLNAAERKSFVGRIKLSRELKKDIEKLSIFKGKKPVLTGTDLIALGYRPGPLFKDILHKVSTASIKSRQGAVRFVIDNFPQKR